MLEVHLDEYLDSNPHIIALSRSSRDCRGCCIEATIDLDHFLLVVIMIGCLSSTGITQDGSKVEP